MSFYQIFFFHLPDYLGTQKIVIKKVFKLLAQVHITTSSETFTSSSDPLVRLIEPLLVTYSLMWAHFMSGYH